MGELQAGLFGVNVGFQFIHELRESKVKARAVLQKAQRISRELHDEPDAQAILEGLDDQL
jgi:hypothetical protein